MKTPLAILMAGTLIAGAVLVSNHWQLYMPALHGTGGIVRLDRWTGSIVMRGIDEKTISIASGKMNGAKIDCERGAE